MKLFLTFNYSFFCVTNKNNVKAILRRFKRLNAFSGRLPYTKNLDGLKGLLVKCNQRGKIPTAFKGVLRLRTHCVQEGTAFKNLLRLIGLFYRIT